MTMQNTVTMIMTRFSMKTQGYVIYPMSMLHDLLKDEEIEKFSELHHFDVNEPFFHFQKNYYEDGNGILESCTADGAELYNLCCESEEEKIVFFDKLSP